MQTLSSASRTCMASASAVEWTATVRMPISRQARWILRAISPRLAMRTFSNMRLPGDVRPSGGGRRSTHDHQDFAELDRAAVADHDVADRAALRCQDRVHHLHRLDDQERLAGLDKVADLDERRGAGLGREI